ncbi:GhoT/OrtT family toxin [Providencia rettgeri]|uniref:GhoT/OrtT family toxin n=1 Tax=Providencia TaxID=586 RepID=UPI001E5C7F98|nr:MULTISPECIES: GhoT/OrtT family toxin [Providencia]MCX9126310.1 GhoT/OrtT family toxin [Providencia rettgeri]MCX9127030.1 GhoT/OrtT family toxin [Providencia rettgeri]UEK58306.1 GhoT/OrtT family toxin [Providencia rettgeri]HEM6845311.1 GhoT/OrtT family toxin [Providencia rettgeri]
MSTFEYILVIYGIGGVCVMLFTLLVTKDPNCFMRLLSAILIGLTWPMTLPIVFMFSLF